MQLTGTWKKKRWSNDTRHDSFERRQDGVKGEREKNEIKCYPCGTISYFSFTIIPYVRHPPHFKWKTKIINRLSINTTRHDTTEKRSTQKPICFATTAAKTIAQQQPRKRLTYRWRFVCFRLYSKYNIYIYINTGTHSIQLNMCFSTESNQNPLANMFGKQKERKLFESIRFIRMVCIHLNCRRKAAIVNSSGAHWSPLSGLNQTYVCYAQHSAHDKDSVQKSMQSIYLSKSITVIQN